MLYRMSKKINNSPKSWLLLLIITSCLLFASLSFQYILMIEPCVLCIYQRISIILIIFVSFFVSVSYLFRQMLWQKVLRFFSYICWIVASSIGLWFAILQWRESILSQNEFFISQCGQGIESIFPIVETNAILNKLFIAKGICSNINWSLFGLEMHHYMSLIFSMMLLSSIFLFLCYCFSLNKSKKNI